MWCVNGRPRIGMWLFPAPGDFFPRVIAGKKENCWKTKEKILTFIFEIKHLALRVVFENAAPAFFFPLCPYKAPISPALWLPLECHVFIYKRETAANALVRCCFHAYADSTYAHQLEEEEQQKKKARQRPTDKWRSRRRVGYDPQLNWEGGDVEIVPTTTAATTKRRAAKGCHSGRDDQRGQHEQPRNTEREAIAVRRT